ncbi:MAG: arylamine N-acetyltransferase [Saprospiraceae bacterium]|nr:arylamine N-acetyltransferase [Saprospiraceae bacterium]
MNLDTYLSRIEFLENPTVERETLIALHRQHVLSIPFEDLDIHWKIPLHIDRDALVDKVIERKRGGFCYELNTLFYHLLVSLGFPAQLVSCQISQGNGKFGPSYDHMAILVELEETWLLDVGYGDLFIEPLRLHEEGIQKDWFKLFQVQNHGEYFLLSEARIGQRFVPRYKIRPVPEPIQAFIPQLRWKERHPDSYFVQNLICSLPSRNGRVTLFNDFLIITKNGKRRKKRVGDAVEKQKYLQHYFGIESGLGVQ